MTGVNEDFYQPATRPGDIIEVEDEETGALVKHMIYLDEFGDGTKTRPLTEEELGELDGERATQALDRARGDHHAHGAVHHEALTVSVGPLTSVKPASVTLICCSFASHAARVDVLTRRLNPELRQRTRIAADICSNASCAA